MGALIRAFDWSQTAIGAPDTWSPTLRIMVRFLLANRFPLLLWWGEKYISIYNDAYRPVLGTKHPWALGQPVSECWSEIWDVLRPLIDEPFHGGSATWIEDLELELRRFDYTEETHFTVAYSPVPDDTAPGGIGGVLATVHEITPKVIGERRAALLRDLGTRAAEAKTAEQACAAAAGTLATNAKDVPFSLLYLIEPDGNSARLAASSGITDASENFSPSIIDLEANNTSWPLGPVRASGHMQIVADLSAKFETVPSGPWSDAPHTAVVLPIATNVARHPAGFLVAGVSARIALDEAYKDFFRVALSPIATAVANARAYEEEKRRAEALAELDRAKTAFFSNVSHEFRTPLTLMLGPLETLLTKVGRFQPEDQQQMQIAHRNSLRLLNLVNTLLDFSRIEAGRFKATYRPVDLGTFTADLAANFRSAMETAGLTFTVDCPPMPEMVYADPEMWEKIVLNLLSNAFKFTFVGNITVRLRAEDGNAVLTVSDTGTGIPDAELPHIFERFHRVEGAHGRSFEGSGIGLALIQELAKLHSGVVTAQSREGEGSIFTVTMPLGKSHLPADRIGDAGELRASRRGAERWLLEHINREAEHPPAALRAHDDTRARIVIADDNADMREHLSRILGENYLLATAANGVEALSLVRANPPDLLLADIMMPGLDGVQLLRAIREDSATRTLPVIFLSARAGEEARVEGIAAGADDYLVKPFTANELRARVGTHTRMGRMRREAEEALRTSQAQLQAEADALARLNEASSRLWRMQNVRDGLGEMLDSAIALLGADMGNIQLLDRERSVLTLTAQRGFKKEFLEFFREVSTEDQSACGRALRSGQRIAIEDVETDEAYTPLRGVAQAAGYRAVQSTPVVGRDGTPLGMFSTHYRLPHKTTEQEFRRFDLYVRQAADFIERCHIDDALRRAAQFNEAILNNMGEGLYTVNSQGFVTAMNPTAENLFGWTLEELRGKRMHDVTHYKHQDGSPFAIEECSGFQVVRQGKSITGYEDVFIRRDGSFFDVVYSSAPIRGNDGVILGLVVVFRDVSGRRRAEEALRTSQQKFADLIERAPFGIYVVNSAFRIAQMNLGSQNGAFKNVRPVIGRDFSEAMRILWPEPVAAEIVARFRNTLETGEPYQSRNFIRARGDIEAVEAYEWELHRLTLANGEYGVVCYYYDSTELRNVVIALRESEERLRLATEHAEIGLWDVDVRNNVLTWPPRVKAMFGISPDVPVSMADFYNGIHPDDRAAISEAYAAAADPSRRGLYDVEYRTAGKEDGRIRWVAAKGRGIFDEHGQCVRVIGTAIDISSRKATEVSLAQSEARYRALAEQVTDGIFITDPQGRYIDANGPASAMLGYTRDDLLTLSILDMLDPSQREKLWQQLEQLATGEVVQGDWPFRRKNGSYFIGDLISRRFADGRMQGVVRDVTERRRVEDELRRANTDLEQFAYSASHDLQEPIRNVAIYSELLEKRYGPVLEGRAQEYLGFVTNGAKRMDALVKDLLVYTKCGAEQDEAAAESNAQMILQRTLESLATTVAETKATVTYDSLPSVCIPPVQLQQVFQNLIGNAIKYRRDGVEPQVHISFERSGNDLTFAVRDNGIGIDPEHQGKVFGLFKRLHNAEKYAGTGIGLAICQKIIERRGGRIWVESGGEGHGSTFYFTLSAAADGSHRVNRIMPDTL